MTPPIKQRLTIISLKSVVCIIALLLGLAIVYFAHDALFVLFLACLVSAALHPAINWLTDHKIPRKLSIGIVYLVFLIILGAVAFFIGSILLDQGKQFIDNLPQYTQAALTQLKTIPLLRHQANMLDSISKQLGSVTAQGSVILFSSLAYVLGLFKNIFSLFTVLIFAFFLLSDTVYFRDTLYNLLPETNRDRTLHVLNTLALRLGAYVRGQLIVVSITGVIVASGLLLMKVPYAIILGILVTLFDIVPVIGPLVSISLGCLITLGSDPAMLPWVLVLYLGAQQIENGLVFPFVMGKTIEIHPAWILLSIFVLSSLIGLPGVIFGVPAAIVINVLLQEYYVNDWLKKRQTTEDIQTLSAETRDLP